MFVHHFRVGKIYLKIDLALWTNLLSLFVKLWASIPKAQEAMVSMLNFPNFSLRSKASPVFASASNASLRRFATSSMKLTMPFIFTDVKIGEKVDLRSRNCQIILISTNFYVQTDLMFFHSSPPTVAICFDHNLSENDLLSSVMRLWFGPALSVK